MGWDTRPSLEGGGERPGGASGLTCNRIEADLGPGSRRASLEWCEGDSLLLQHLPLLEFCHLSRCSIRRHGPAKAINLPMLLFESTVY